MPIHRASTSHFLLATGKYRTMPRSPTLLVLGALALLLLWSAAAGWSCRPRVRAAACGGVGLLQLRPPGHTHIVPKPLASHNLNNREIHGLSKSSEGGLRAVLGEVTDIRRSKKCICTRPFCQHPQGQARQGHEEVQLTADQHALYFPATEGWVCDDMLFPGGAEAAPMMREPSDTDPPPKSGETVPDT